MDSRFECLRVECRFCVHYKENTEFCLRPGRPEMYCDAMSRMVKVPGPNGPRPPDGRVFVMTPGAGMCWLFARKIDFPLEER